MTPIKPTPCNRNGTIVDRFNKPLRCFAGESIRPDIWIQPDKKCPRFLSHRCTPCRCISPPLCIGNTFRRIKSWDVKFVNSIASRGLGWWCCTPSFECTSSFNSSPAPKPSICDQSVCPHGGNPDNPDLNQTWDAKGLLRPCPAAPFCKPPLVLIEAGIGSDGCMKYTCGARTPPRPPVKPPLPRPCGLPGMIPC